MDREFNINNVPPSGETQDSQEFSPSCFERSFVPSPNCFTSRYDITMTTLLSHLTFVYRGYTELFNVMSGIYIGAVLLLQSFLRTQQCGVPDHSLHPGAEQLISSAHPKKEDQEETEAQGQEKTGEEEGEASTQTSNAFWSPWTGEWKFSGPDSGKSYS